MKLSGNKLYQFNYWHYIYLLLGSVIALTTIYGVYINYSPVPFWDEWDGSVRFMVDILNGDAAAWYYPHNEHRIIFSKLITWLDYMFWGGLNKFPLFMNVLLQAFTLTLLALIVHKFTRIRSMILFVVGAGLGFLFSWVQVENWTWGFQNQFFAVYAFALLSFFSFVYHHFLYDQKKCFHSWLFFIISILSAIICALTMSNGLIVLPLLLILALVLKVSLFKVFFIGALGIISWLLYFGNNYNVSHVSPIDSIINYPLQLILYSFAYLGSPTAYLLGFASHYLIITIAVGALLSLCFLFFILDMVRKREFSPIKLVLIFFVLFIFGSALVTAFGRIHFGLGSALAVRYSTPALLAWFSVLLMGYEHVNLISGRYQRHIYTTVNILIILLLFLFLPIQRLALTPHYSFLFNKDASLLALSMDIRDEQYIKHIYFADLDQVIATARKAKELELGVFSLDWYKRVQESGNEYIDIHGIGFNCKGNIDTVEYVSENNAYRIKGWVLDKDKMQVPSHLVVVTPNGKVIGYGVSGEYRPDVSGLYEGAPENTGWLAYVNYFDWERAHVYSISEKGLCKIPGEIKLGEVQTAIKSLSLSDEFIRISDETSLKIIKNDWLEDALPVEIENNEIISDMQLFSSWINSDEATGTLSFEFVIENRQFHLPYITGPVYYNQKINIFEKVSDEYYLIFKGVLPASVHEWSYLIIDLDIDQGSVIRVDLVDDGGTWGEWSAIAIPVY